METLAAKRRHLVARRKAIFCRIRGMLAAGRSESEVDVLWRLLDDLTVLIERVDREFRIRTACRIPDDAVISEGILKMLLRTSTSP